MMEPLSRKKRYAYLLFFTALFLVMVPLFIFYAKGYRVHLNQASSVELTGGIFVSTNQSGVEIYINNELVRKTSIVQKNTFEQDLKPGTYDVRVSKSGLQTWHKTLTVYPEMVSEAHTFLLKEHPVLTEIPRYASSTSNLASTTRAALVKNVEYDNVLALFNPPIIKKTTAVVASTTESGKNSKKIETTVENGQLHVRWNGEFEAIPSFFCKGNDCKDEIIVTMSTPVLSYESYVGRDDVVIVRLADGIYVTEIAEGGNQNVQTIVTGAGYDVRVKDGSEIYLKLGNKLFSVAI